MANILSKYIKQLEDFELIDEDNKFYTNLVPVSEAVDILERFEAEMIQQLDCEQLEQLKKEGVLQ